MDDSWLQRFHEGDRDALEACYRQYFRTVDGAVGQVLHGADRETVVQDVFLQLISSGELRRGFTGGAFGAWIATLARSRAIDFWRRYRHERALAEAAGEPAPGDPAAEAAGEIEARLLIERFRREVLPPKWAGVFEERFLGGLDQRTAAQRLGISRTTLAYREMQVSRLLERFLLRSEGKGK
jgi:RNA polymerase sigma-70 factor (ECF subfamily)